MSKRNVFAHVGGLHPSRSVFDLSYEKKLTCDMAQLIPVLCDEMVPGDFFQIGNQAVVRFQPLVAPILHEINMYVHYFFVPYRLLWDDWEILSPAVKMDSLPELSLSGNPLIRPWDPCGIIWDFPPVLTRTELTY